VLSSAPETTTGSESSQPAGRLTSTAWDDADVVPVVRLRRRVERRHPHDVGSKGPDVIDSLDDARDVANPIAVTVAEAPRIDVLNPSAWGRRPGPSQAAGELACRPGLVLVSR
jgi:hypothetical protein